MWYNWDNRHDIAEMLKVVLNTITLNRTVGKNSFCFIYTTNGSRQKTPQLPFLYLSTNLPWDKYFLISFHSSFVFCCVVLPYVYWLCFLMVFVKKLIWQWLWINKKKNPLWHISFVSVIDIARRYCLSTRNLS